MLFCDRQEAGRKLAKILTRDKNKDTIVLALPRGGVPVALEISKKLSAPLGVIVVRKIGAPYQPEYGLGAISEADTLVLDRDRMLQAHVSLEDLEEIINSEREELKRRIKLYRKNKKLTIKNKVVILVDDGLATGVTARAASDAAKKLGAKKIIFASPVCATQSILRLEKYVDKVVCLSKQDNLDSIGNYYENFEQVSDGDVIKLLKNYEDSCG
jgi:putative phosphoribosyl transferase